MSFGLPPVLDENRLTYGSYLQVGHLTGLQTLMSDPPQHDELLFIIIHQVFELWFKQLLHELDEVRTRLDADQALGAQRVVRRCIEIERVLIQQITVLETMTPNDFLTFRDHLMPASGFQSAQFRSIEYLCGLKNPRHIQHYPEGTPEREALERRLNEPTLGDAFFGMLRRKGVPVPEGDSTEDHEARVHGLLSVYQNPDANYAAYLLAESLIEFDEVFVLWRLHHVTMVERMIGNKPGTGGSEGVSYLKRTVDQKFFPELWEMRSLLSNL